MDSNPDKKDARAMPAAKWQIEKTVPIAAIILVVGQLVVLAVYGGRLDERVSNLERSYVITRELAKTVSATKVKVDLIANQVSNIELRISEAILPAAKVRLDAHTQILNDLRRDVESLRHDFRRLKPLSTYRDGPE